MVNFLIQLITSIWIHKTHRKKLVNKEQTLIFIPETPDFPKNVSKSPSQNFQEYFTNSDLEITTYIFPGNILF
jgi:hypothetical protein